MIKRARTIIAASLMLLAPMVARDGRAQTVDVDREISQLKGNLYQLRAGDQHTVFLVTPSGIALVDPLSVETAQWLMEELPRRFPPGVVRYVLHTSLRFDRAEGNSIFRDAGEVIGHRSFNSSLSEARHNGAQSVVISDRVRAKDRNGDGRVTAEELYTRVHDVESFFDERRNITLGATTIELVHVPSGAAPEDTIVNFRSERVAFTADAPPLDAAPFTFGTWNPNDVKRWLATVASLDFDTLVLGDGRSVPKARIARLSSYVNELSRRVADDYERGGSAEKFTAAKLPQSYLSDSTFREWRSNVDDLYRHLSLIRVEATVGGLGHYAIRDRSYCQGFTTCSTGGMVPAATGSVSVGAGRWAAVGELAVTNESFTSNNSRFVDEEFALVETRTSFMMRYTRVSGGASLRFLGGMSHTIGDREGIRRIKEGVAPFAGRRPLASHDARWGYTGGIDLAFGRKIGIVLPMRFNYARQDSSGTFPNRMDAQVGVALTMRLFRSID
jgi:glyoxylase-like metal-dependent hydrolase (beta-lactamase superfamily II)